MAWREGGTFPPSFKAAVRLASTPLSTSFSCSAASRVTHFIRLKEQGEENLAPP